MQGSYQGAAGAGMLMLGRNDRAQTSNEFLTRQQKINAGEPIVVRRQALKLRKVNEASVASQQQRTTDESEPVDPNTARKL